MSNNKQSSVEWFWLNLNDDLIGGLSPEKISKIYEIKEQAKAMHEVQVRRAFYDGQRYEGTKSSMDYYNETFVK